MKSLIKTLSLISLFTMLIMFSSFSAEATGSAEGHLPRYYRQLLTFFGVVSSCESQSPPDIEVFEYVIRPGDTLFLIAKQYGTDVDTLAYLNRIKNPHYIRPGDVIEVITVTGTVHTVQSGETWEQIAMKYQVGPEEIIGISGAKKNNLQTGERVLVTGSRGMEVPGRNAASPSFAPPSFAPPSFIWPLQGTITSRFGWRNSGFHYGLDIAAPTGTVVKAAASGTVTCAAYRGNYGLLVEIDHGNAWVTRYAHNSRALVSVGQKVNQGEAVSLVGATGDATGPHVHLEIIFNGNKLDPLNHLPQ